MKKVVFFLIFFTFLVKIANSESIILTFNHFNSTLKSYISYILFTNKQSIVAYKENTIYNFNYSSIEIKQEIYARKGIYFPATYIPPQVGTNKKDKSTKMGSLATIIKDNQIMYLFDYGTPNFYRYLDYDLIGIIVSLEDNIQKLVNNLNNAEKINYKPFLDYIKAFGNVNQDFELILCYNQQDKMYFEFLNKKSNKIKVFFIDKYYRFNYFEKEYPCNETFSF